ncbi:MAG: BrnT family toxin [Bryobacteraceae bacterium]
MQCAATQNRIPEKGLGQTPTSKTAPATTELVYPSSDPTQTPTEPQHTLTCRLTVHTLICTLELCCSNGTRKAAANVRKHGARFSEALGVVSDNYAITNQDIESDSGEERFITLGMGIKGRVPAVVYCYASAKIRIISARMAGRPEREQYETRR